MADRIQHRRDTAERWSQFNPILLEGEVGYVLDDANQYRIGDGINAWNDLPLRGEYNVTQIGADLKSGGQLSSVEMVSSYGINYTTGNVVPSPSVAVTNVINLTEVTKIEIGGRNSTQIGCVFYDIAGNKIIPTGSSNYTTTTPNGIFVKPSNAVSMRISQVLGQPLLIALITDKGIVSSIAGCKIKDAFSNDTPVIEATIELTFESGYGIDYTTGECVVYSGAKVAKNIICENFRYISIFNRTTGGGTGIVFFDENGNKLKYNGLFKTETANGTFEIPLLSKKVSITFSLSDHPRVIFGNNKNIAGSEVTKINGRKIKQPKLSISGNLYISSNDELGAGIDYTTGEIVPAKATVSELIEVEANTYYTLSGRTSYSAKGVIGFDSNGNMITRSLFTGAITGQMFGDTLNGTFFTSTDVKSIRLTTSYAGTDRSTISLKKTASNLINTNNATTYGIDYTTGALVADNRYRVTELISVKPNTYYRLNGRLNSTSKGAAGYDSNSAIISRSLFTGATTGGKFGDTLNGIFYTGNDVKKVRFTIYSSFNSSYTLAQQLARVELVELIGYQPKNKKVKKINDNEIIASSLVDEYGEQIIVNKIANPEYNISSGVGTEASPYLSSDGSAGFNESIGLISRGGKLIVPSKRFDVSTPIQYNVANVHVEGEIWNYPNDPNGVYESSRGSKIKLLSNEIAAMQVVAGGGGRISQIGFQGIVSNGATKGLFSLANAAVNCGLNFPSARVDQFELYRLSFCGLASGISVSGGSIDACIFDRINTDGCNVGIYFSPEDTYYAKIKDSVLADCPAHGLWVKKATGGNNLQMLTIENLVLVRNGGGFTDEQLLETEAASLLVTGVVNSKIINNQIDSSGTYWNSTAGRPYTYEYCATCCGLILSGKFCLVSNNRINGAQSNSAIIRGDKNLVVGNQINGTKAMKIIGDYNKVSNNWIGGSDYSIEVEGSNNIVSENLINTAIHVMSGSNNRIVNCLPYSTLTKKVIIESGVTNTILIGYDASEVTDNGTGTIYK